MKKIFVLLILTGVYAYSYSQTKSTRLFNLVKLLIQDTSEYPTSGDWAVGHPGRYPVKWSADKIEMSTDEKINFYRTGKAQLQISQVPSSDIWNVMLMGPRSGFSSFSLTSPRSSGFLPKTSLDSLFKGGGFSATLLKKCDTHGDSGYYYYQVHIPGKTLAWIKTSWDCIGGPCQLRLEVFDDWSKQFANLKCHGQNIL